MAVGFGVPVSAEVFTIDPSDSINATIFNASSGDTIVLNPGIYYENNIIFSKDIVIQANQALGGNQTNTIVDGIGGQSGIFEGTDATTTLTINNLTLRNGVANDNSGGAIYTQGNVAVTSSTFIDCSATNRAGGAIYAINGDVTVTDSNFTNCSAASGGAMYVENGDMIVTDSSFIDCNGTTGGAINAFRGEITVTRSFFTHCSSVWGGAIFTFGDMVTVTDSRFSDCSVTSTFNMAGAGGAVYSYHNITVTRSTFTNCSASNYGGAIYSDYGNVTVTSSSTFKDCSTNGIGGAIIAFRGTVTVTDATFTNCSANSGGDGGGAFYSLGPATVTGSTFTNCSAYGGGAIFSHDSVTVTSSIFTNCLASTIGGAIYSNDGNVTVKRSTFSDCLSRGWGGAIYLYGNLTVTDSTISDCSASDGNGGAIVQGWNEGSVTVTDSTITNCSATGSGGAIWALELVTVTSSSITNCSAVNNGGAIYLHSSSSSTIPTMVMTSSTISNCSAASGSAVNAYSGIIQFCRLVNNNGGIAVYSSGGTVTATNNWWGSNSSPSAQVSSGVSYSPWLVLGATATPASITSADTSTVQANLTYDSDGTNHDPALGHVPDAIPAVFKISSGPGSVSPGSAGTVSGLSQTMFTPTTAGTATVNATVDGQTVSAIIEISGGAPPTVLPGLINPPTDPDGDGIYEDLNGNGRLDFADVVLYFNQMTWIAANEPVSAFDLNGNGRIDFADIVALFNEI